MAKILNNTDDQYKAEKRRFKQRQKKFYEAHFSAEDKKRIEKAKEDVAAGKQLKLRI